jgi:tetratricopeptide (TPR) repeat protein
MLKIGIENDHLIAMVSGYQALGMAYFALGEFDKAGFNLESALDTKGQEITGINCYPSMTMDYLSYVLFITGDSVAARKMCDDAYLSALKESDYSTASALSNGSVTQMLLGNIDIVCGNAADLVVLAEEKGQHMYLNRGLLFKNLSQAIIERDESYLQYAVDAIQKLLESKEEIDATCLLGITAETQISFQQFDRAAASLAQALAIANKNDERFYESELHRLKAELAMAQRGIDWQAIAAEQLNKARKLAQSQNARGWLTKIATSEQQFLETNNDPKVYTVCGDSARCSK